MKFSFDPSYVPLLSRFMAKQDIRYYLNGIRVEPSEKGGVYLVATNGHIMLVIHDLTGTFEGDAKSYASIRLTPWFISACKSRDVKSYVLRAHLDGKRLYIGPESGEHHHTLETFVQGGSPFIEGNFPNWRRLLPDFSSLESGGFVNGGVATSSLVPFHTSSKYSVIRLWRAAGATDGQATYVQMVDMPEALGIVMPTRGDYPHQFIKHMPGAGK